MEYVRDSDPQTELSQTRHITTKVGCKHCNGYFCIQVAVGALIYVFHSLNYIYIAIYAALCIDNTKIGLREGNTTEMDCLNVYVRRLLVALAHRQSVHSECRRSGVRFPATPYQKGKWY